MKFTLTILFAIVLCSTKAQTPVDTAKALTGDEIIIDIFPEDEWRRFKCVIPQLYPIIAPPVLRVTVTPPVDMMVRHYFGINYWD